jgi:hypothetical protein
MSNLIELRQYLFGKSQEYKLKFPRKIFGYAGLIPTDENFSRYVDTPVNTTIFAHTGGDGCHFSHLNLNQNVDLFILTVPMLRSNNPRDSNIILSCNFDNFLSLGYNNGWFGLEQILYGDFEIMNIQDDDPYFLESLDYLLVKEMRSDFKINSILFSKDYFESLQNMYFDYLDFKLS